VAAGNAHLSAIVICGGLIEHERFVLLRTKVVDSTGFRGPPTCRIRSGVGFSRVAQIWSESAADMPRAFPVIKSKHLEPG
jgi:hypothetical protein